jgi:hypothetical protein
MDPNIYLNAIVFYGLAQCYQKQKSVPEPEFRRFDLTYLVGTPGKRDHSQDLRLLGRDHFLSASFRESL